MPGRGRRHFNRRDSGGSCHDRAFPQSNEPGQSARQAVRLRHCAHGRVGRGRLYQGPLKSLAVEEDEHLLTVRRPRGAQPTPLHHPSGWLKWVRRPQAEAELEAVCRSVVRGRPVGNDRWSQRTAKRFGLESTFRRRGRPSTMSGSELRVVHGLSARRRRLRFNCCRRKDGPWPLRKWPSPRDAAACVLWRWRRTGFWPTRCGRRCERRTVAAPRVQ